MSTVKPDRRMGQAGLTLVEFMIATSIMAFVALGVAGMFPSALRSVIGGGQMTKATILAQAMADMIRNESFDTLASGYNGFDTRSLSVTCPLTGPDLADNKKKWTCDLVTDTAQATGRGLPGGYGTVSVGCLTASGAVGSCATTDLRQVNVAVFWDRSGSRSVNLVTYVARTD